MIFLIEYDRAGGRVISLNQFEDAKRLQAQEARLDLELRLSKCSVEREVVLLEAPSYEALTRTHRRYFEDLQRLAESTST